MMAFAERAAAKSLRYAALNPVATALNPVRSDGHHQAGRLEKRLSRWTVTRGLRQDKDDFTVVLHLIVPIVRLFIDHDGILQMKAPCREQRFDALRIL